MSRKLDLNNYLNKYISSHEKPSHNESMSRTNPQDFKAGRPPTSDEPLHYTEEFGGGAPSIRQTGGFQKAQLECLEELQDVKRTLIEQERQISHFLSNFHKRIGENLHREHHRIRQEVLELFERAFEANQKRIDEAIASLTDQDNPEFVSIRKRIAQVNQDIARLEQGLKGSNYRQVIAEVVTSDFQSVTKELRQLVGNAEKLVYERSPKLILNDKGVNQLQEDLLNLVMIDWGRSRAEGQQVSGGQLPNNLQQRPDSRKNKLFEAPSDKQGEKSSFFNFK